MRSLLSDEVHVLARPFATYRRAAVERAQERGALVSLRGPALFSLVIACFVSWTTTGRLVGHHLAFAPVSWAWLPLLQVGWLWAVTRVMRERRPFAQLVDLYFLGHAPWYLLLLGTAGVCLFVPEPSRVLLFLWTSRGVLALLLLFIAWGMFLTFAFFRAGVGMSWWRALAATLLFYIGVIGSGFGYYGALGQLVSIIP